MCTFNMKILKFSTKIVNKVLWFAKTVMVDKFFSTKCQVYKRD